MFAEALSLAVDLPRPPNWERLGEHLPYEWIEQALAYSGKASLRRRRLPAEQVVWLVIALALYRQRSVREVVAELDLAMPELDGGFVTGSAISQARQRLGEEPLRWLFERSAAAWNSQDQSNYLFHGMALFAMDGTTLRAADSEANREHFGASAHAGGAIGSYPQTRGVTLTALPTHLVVDARFGPYGTSEVTFAKELVKTLPDRSLTVFDRGFFSAEVLLNLASQGQGRHFLIPAKGNTKWRLLEGTADDGIVEMEVSRVARKKAPGLPSFWRARAIRVGDSHGQAKYLLTSLTDRKLFKAAEVVACYGRRWHIETSYRELKHTMLGNALTLRSQTVDGVYQEIWGCLIAYNLIRLEIAKAALTAKCAPTDVSFIVALHTIQFELLHAAVVQSHGKLPALLQRLRERLVTELKAARPGRSFDRVVKAKAQRYPEKRLRKQT